MKIYYTDDPASAQLCRQLIQLSADCVRLRWSKTIPELPDMVSDALDTVQDYTEAKLHELCPETALVLELTEAEESVLLALGKSSEEFRKSAGSGVILSGDEARRVRAALRDCAELSRLLEPLDSTKSLVLL